MTAETLWRCGCTSPLVVGGFPTVSRELHSGRERNFFSVYQVIGLLVPVSYMHYCTSTSGLSTQ